MRIFYSELCLIGNAVESNVDRLIEAGADYIELMIDGAGWNDFHLHSEDVAARLRRKDVGYSVHVPVWDANLTSENAILRRAVLESYRHSISLAAKIGAEHVVLHPGFCSDPHFDKKLARERARDSILSLLEPAASSGLLLLVENVGTRNNSIFDQEQFASFLDGFPPGVGYVLDVGHAHIAAWDFETLLPALGERLHALHLHDNDGSKDAHAPIGSGSIDWPRLLELASNRGGDLGLVLEYNIGTDLQRLVEGKAYLESIFPGRFEGRRDFR